MTCVLHSDRIARQDVTGIPICDECLESYQIERRMIQNFDERHFFQSLVRARHKLNERQETSIHTAYLSNS